MNRLGGRSSVSVGPEYSMLFQYNQSSAPGTEAGVVARKCTGMLLRAEVAALPRNSVVHSVRAAWLVAAAKVSAWWPVLGSLYARATRPLTRSAFSVYFRASAWSWQS